MWAPRVPSKEIENSFYQFSFNNTVTKGHINQDIEEKEEKNSCCMQQNHSTAAPVAGWVKKNWNLFDRYLSRTSLSARSGDSDERALAATGHGLASGKLIAGRGRDRVDGSRCDGRRRT